jgi:hypothetical protein
MPAIVAGVAMLAAAVAWLVRRALRRPEGEQLDEADPESDPAR